MEEIKQNDIKQQEVVPGISKVEIAPEKMQEIQKEITEVLQKHNVYLEIVPTYNLVVKPKL